MARVIVAGRGFRLAGSGRSFTPWGFNYDRDHRSRLVEDYWGDEWGTVVEDFREMRDLGANVVRFHLQFARFMKSPDEPDAAELDRLSRLLDLAEATGLRIDLTGLCSFRDADVPPWYRNAPETDRWGMQARFWEAVASRAARSPALFCYTLMNEPISPAGPVKEIWTGHLGGFQYCEHLTLDPGTRDRNEVTRAWMDRLIPAIRGKDPKALITVGSFFVSDAPGSYTLGPDLRRAADPLDFVSVHLYPREGKVAASVELLQAAAATGKPVVIQEMYPIHCGIPAFKEFLETSRTHAAGWISFYWGKTIEECRRAGTIGDAITATWLEFLKEEGPRFRDGVRPPNIVWIFAEDIGPDLSGCGVPAVKTPNLDRLAAGGIRYARAYTTAPVCSTSRSAMITGMHQNAIGAHQHRTPDPKPPLPGDVVPFPVLLRRLGYFTGLMISRKTDFNFRHDVKKIFEGGDWKEAAGRPFFVQITLANTHRPWKNRPEFEVDPAAVEVPPYYPDTPLVRRDLANGLEEMEAMDEAVGRILRRLEDEGLAENTLVVFIGDNGRAEPRGKQFLYEGGVHVPLILRWPGRIAPGKVTDELVSAIDVTASVLAAAGAGVPAWMQGRDLLAPGRRPREAVFFARDKMDDTHDAMRACRDGRYKYILNLMPERAWCQRSEYKEKRYPVLAQLNVMHLKGQLNAAQDAFMKPEKPVEELYDLEADPYETRNLAGDPAHAAALERLRRAVAGWRSEIRDPGVSDEFRRGGASSAYPTRTLGEWEEILKTWERELLGAR